MTNRTSPVRRHSRFPVCWAVLYGGDEFLAEGTVLDLTQISWRVAGSMPVMPGMQFTLQLWVPDKPEPVRLERATVLWVKDCGCATEAHAMSPTDQAWVTEFLNQKLEISWMSRAADDWHSRRIMDEESREDTNFQHAQRPGVEDIMRLFIDAQTDMKDLDAVVIWGVSPSVAVRRTKPTQPPTDCCTMSGTRLSESLAEWWPESRSRIDRPRFNCQKSM